MPKGCFQNIVVKGIATAVPDKIRDTADWFETFGRENVEKFVKMTGVQSIFKSGEKQTASDLAFVAARKLLEKKNVSPQDVGALVFVTQGPDYRLPATACVLQHRLGLSEDCICFDVILGCSGYVNGLTILASLMVSSDTDKGLLLVGDTSTKGISGDDKSSAMLFGDSGAATLLCKEVHSDSTIQYHLRTDGNRFKAIIKPAGAYRNRNASPERVLWNVDGNIRSDYETYMNGADVFSFSISDVPKLIREFFKDTETSVDDYDCFALHQANLYILRQIAKKMKIPQEKMLVSMDRFGNTSVTSIPLTLAKFYGDDDDSHINALMCGFGVGLSWGVVTAKIEKKDILPMIYTNEFFQDGGVEND